MQKTAVNEGQEKFSEEETEYRLTRSLFTSFLGEDEEGTYRSEFIRETLEAARERPTEQFTTPEAFLARLKNV